MGHTTNYTKVREERGLTKQQTDEVAIQDLQEWLGEERFDMVVQAAQSASAENFAASMEMFCGVTGYPVAAMLRKYNKSGFIAYLAEGGLVVDEDGFPTGEANHESS